MNVFGILRHSSLTIVIIAFTVVVLQILDLSSGDVWARKWKDPALPTWLAIYSIIFIVSLIAQVYFLVITTRISVRSKKRGQSLALIISRIYISVQLAVIILLIFVLAEQLLTYQYHIIIPELVLGLSILTSVVILTLLAAICFKTFLSSKNKLTLLYGLSIFILAVQLTSTVVFIEANLYNKPHTINTERNPWITGSFNSFLHQLFQIYGTVHLISFIAVWTTTIMFTRSLSHNIGKIKYLIVVTIPLIYFSLQYLPNLLDLAGWLNPLIMTEEPIFQYFHNFVVNTINVGSGLLFGVAFFILSRVLINDKLKYYLIMCGCGIMIIFSSNLSRVLIMTTFPIWGLVSLSFILPASFMILIGFNSSASFIANDYKIRALLNKSRKEFELFKSLGSVELKTAIERKVRVITNQINEEQTDQALFMSKSESQDISKYVSEVMDVVNRSRVKYKNKRSDELDGDQ